MIKLDNQTVAQTSWRPCSQQAWDQRFSIDLDKSRELEIGVYWRDWRSLCGVKFLRLEEFIDDIRHGMALQLEPQGLLFAEVQVSIYRMLLEGLSIYEVEDEITQLICLNSDLDLCSQDPFYHWFHSKCTLHKSILNFTRLNMKLLNSY